jgi:hypothetical protein
MNSRRDDVPKSTPEIYTMAKTERSAVQILRKAFKPQLMIFNPLLL